MLYVLLKGDCTDLEVAGAYEGPPGLDVTKLSQDFLSEFDFRKLGPVKYPTYKGPMQGSMVASGSLASGGCYSGNIEGTSYDTSSPEYQEYRRLCEQAREEWDRKREERIVSLRSKYPGETIHEMLYSYLEKHFSLRKVEEFQVSYL